jgi:hypothetical protein
LLAAVGIVISEPTLSASSGSTFNFEGDPGPDECQTCIQLYATGVDTAYGYFRMGWKKLSELDPNGNECCTNGGSCPALTGCNTHVIVVNPVFTTTQNTTSVNYDGYLRGGGGGQTSSCTPPGSPLICVQHQFENHLNDGSSAVTYTIAPGATLSIAPQALRTTIRILSWPFAAGSRGVRIQLVVMGRLVGISHFYLEPGAVEAPETESTNNFDGVTLEDDQSYAASFYFAHQANIDGVARDVNVTGLRAHEFDDNAKYILIDIPVFSNFAEYTLYSYMSDLQGGGAASLTGDFWYDNRAYFIGGGAALGGLILCGVCCCIVYKVKGRKKHHHHEEQQMQTKKRRGSSSSSSSSSSKD